MVPPPESAKPKDESTIRWPELRRSARHGVAAACSARAPLRRESGKPARLERVREHQAGSALGIRARQHRPVELGHQVVERPVGQVLAQQRLELVRPALVRVLAREDERAVGHMPEAEGAACDPQPVVVVRTVREIGIVAADGVEHASMQHGGRRDDRVVAAKEALEQVAPREVARPPCADGTSLGVDRDRVAVHDASPRSAVEQGDLARDPVGQRDAVVVDPCDQLAARLTDDRVVGSCGTAGRLVAHHAQPFVGELGEQLGGAIHRAIVDDEHLEVGVGLRAAAVDRGAQGGRAGPRRDRERDAWVMRVHAGSIGSPLASLENGRRTAFNGYGR
jgi:hypothetical protein